MGNVRVLVRRGTEFLQGLSSCCSFCRETQEWSPSAAGGRDGSAGTQPWAYTRCPEEGQSPGKGRQVTTLRCPLGNENRLLWRWGLREVRRRGLREDREQAYDTLEGGLSLLRAARTGS